MKSHLWFRLFVLAVTFLTFHAGAQQLQGKPSTNAPATLTELRRRISERINEPRFSAGLWGIKVVSQDSGEVVFEHNADKLFTPASNSKLFTVALALTELGPDYRIKTSAYAKARPNQDRVLEGDLLVYGRGDPTINARLNQGDIFKALQPLAQAITNAGVKRVTGNLVGDASHFRGSEYGSGWVCDDPQYYYGAEISALSINDNTVQAFLQPGEAVGAACRVTLKPQTDYLKLHQRVSTVDKEGLRAVTVYRPLGGNVVYLSGTMPIGDPGYTEDLTLHKPEGLFVALLREVLARHGVAIAGGLRTVDWLEREEQPLALDQLVEVASVQSLPMKELVREVQKPSQNLYTDLLLAHVGEKTRGPATRPGRTSEELGIAALNRFLLQAGIPPGGVIFEEGSGLSRNNLLTPSAVVALLQYMEKQPTGPVYMEALPIAGVDGTLRNRMKGTPAAGQMKAKTGTLRWANALSGHLKTAAGERLVFSLILNRYQDGGTGRSARAELDALGVLLASFTGRTR